jgi:predicted SAM-dependent methyltransferase
MAKKTKNAKKPAAAAPRTLGPAAATAKLPMAPPPVTLKLDLACGQRPLDGFEGVDIWPEAKHVLDLTKFPWPWEDSSVAEINCSHFAEHLAMVHVDEFGNHVQHGGQDLFFRFMDECYRILIPGGWMTIVVPSGRSNRAFQDPTHRRFFVEPSFAYLAADWRKEQKLDHYNVKCDFGINVQTTVDTLLNAKVPAVAQREMHNYWNTTVDFHAKCQCVKPARF